MTVIDGDIPHSMDPVTRKLKSEAERIASRHRLPEFYNRFRAPLAMARRIYYTHPLVIFLRALIRPRLREHLGHGLHHSMRVAIDGAALIYLELATSPTSLPQIERWMMLGELAGLLHDICRGEDNHAAAGAREAKRLLADFPLGEEELQCVCLAIANHEAFTHPMACARPWMQVVSDCLYDADKFRWGPDNFTHTLWHMVHHQHLSARALIDRFPWGMAGLVRIQDTFRTVTGRQYGPDIIDAGLEIGKEIYRYLIQHCVEE